MINLLNLITSLIVPMGVGIPNNNTGNKPMLTAKVSVNNLNINGDGDNVYIDSTIRYYIELKKVNNYQTTKIAGQVIDIDEKINALENDLKTLYRIDYTIDNIYFNAIGSADDTHQYAIDFQIHHYFTFYFFQPDNPQPVKKITTDINKIYYGTITLKNSIINFNTNLFPYPIAGTTTTLNFENVVLPLTQEIGNAFDNGYQKGEEQGYQDGYAQGARDGKNWQNVLVGTFDSIDSVLNVEILPSIKLWYLVALPLIFAVLKFILGLFR